MLLNLENLVKKYNLEIKGVVHIGAHYGQEYFTYKKLNINNIMFFEPVEKTFNILKNNIGENAILINSALGNIIGEIDMFTENINKGQSSSILEPKQHLLQHPNIIFDGKTKVKITKLDTFLTEVKNYNFINIDVQGYELEVFRGGKKFLENIDYIITEVNRAELYKNCPLVEDIDSYLKQYNFVRVETTWDGGTWGDAFYIKNK